jgi:transposase
MKREEGKGIKAWELTDEMGETASRLIPERKREEGRTYQRKPGGGRKPLPPRQVFAAIFFVLRTGIQWKALPREYGAASSVHEYFSEWAQAGLFMRLWQEGLLSYDELRGIGWEWQSADGCMVKAPLARESVGNNPTDRGKKRDETQPCGRVTRITDRYSHKRSQQA